MIAGRPTRTLQIVLFVSLAINIFLAGFVVARAFGPFWHTAQPRGPEMVVERLTAHLHDKDAATLRAAFQNNRAQLDELWRGLVAARAEVRAKLIAEPLDRDALAKAMANARERHQAFFAAVGTAILQAVPQMSQDGRERMWNPKKR